MNKKLEILLKRLEERNKAMALLLDKPKVKSTTKK